MKILYNIAIPKWFILIGVFIWKGQNSLFANPSDIFKDSTYISIVSFNVENLFDTIPSMDHDDAEYTPSSEKQWISSRYYKKLKDLSKAISFTGGVNWPMLVALQEVENERVLSDLVNSRHIHNANYQYIVSKGEDKRGINVALLYNKNLFLPYTVEQWNLYFPNNPRKKTRPLLCTIGRLKNNFTLAVIVVHLPSRQGGFIATQKEHKIAYQLLQQKCDSLLSLNPHMGIIVLGDFNAGSYEPQLKTFAPPMSRKNSEAIYPNKMYDISFARNKSSAPGSYYFQGVYNQLDRILISGNVINDSENNGFKYIKGSFSNVYLEGKMKVLLTKKVIPRRTYGGKAYIGGTSDHLPIKALFVIY